MIPTPHIDATSKDDVADLVLLPGDPLRAKFIAENFLSEARLFNQSRNMLGYTGNYEGRRISVMGTGMGIPSIALYSYELIHFYGVKKLIRIGSCGALQSDLQLRDIVMAMSTSYDSSYASQFGCPGTLAPSASFNLLLKATSIAEQNRLRFHVGNVLSSDIFYLENPDSMKQWAKMGILAVEMEAAALYLNAARANAEALCILTVSDSLVTGEQLSSQERETGFHEMVDLALKISA